MNGRSSYEVVAETLDKEIFLPFCADVAAVYDQKRADEICAAHGWTMDEVIEEATRRIVAR